MRNWTRAIAAAGLGWLTLTGTGLAQVQNPPPRPANRPAAATEETTPGTIQNRVPNPRQAKEDLPGPIDNPKDVQDSLKMLFMAADTNNDGQISKKEAVDVGNLLIGGFFFRADANGDGVLTQQEARAAREQVLRTRPILSAFVQEIRSERSGGNQPGQAGGTNSPSPFRGLADLLDTNNDKQLQAAEVRQAVQTGVDGLYASADTNRDGQLSPAELNAAALGFARAGALAIFRKADADNNGSISQAEFDKAIVQPAHVVFGVIDANNDGQISQQEAQQAEHMLLDQLVARFRPPDASGTRAPIPTFGTPTGPTGSNTNTQPRTPTSETRPGAAPQPRE